jgi:hypothetical protein
MQLGSSDAVDALRPGNPRAGLALKQLHIRAGVNVAKSRPGGGRFDRNRIEIPVARAVLRHDGLRNLRDRLRRASLTRPSSAYRVRETGIESARTAAR